MSVPDLSAPALFEGRPLPPADALLAALRGEPAERARLVRAGVVDADLCEAIGHHATALLGAQAPADRGLGLELLRALALRSRVAGAVARFDEAPEAFLGVPDPQRPGRTLAQSLLAFVVEGRPRGAPDIEAFLHRALGVPELQVEVAYAIAADAPAALVPHLGSLLSARPELATPLGTLFALRAPEAALAACTAAAQTPTAEAFAQGLLRGLERTHAVALAARCRRILRGD